MRLCQLPHCARGARCCNRGVTDNSCHDPARRPRCGRACAPARRPRRSRKAACSEGDCRARRALVEQLRVRAGPGVVSGFASLPEELTSGPCCGGLPAPACPWRCRSWRRRASLSLFRAWAPGDAMDKGVWGIPEPKADKPEVEPDILLVPLLAFDVRGGRLGYGGGFYDRTLARLRAQKAHRRRWSGLRRAAGRRGPASRL